MDKLDQLTRDLAEPDRVLLHNIVRGMGITADLSRSDLLLFRPRGSREAVVLAQAQPHSISSIYSQPLVGQKLDEEQVPAIFESGRRRQHVRSHRDLVPSGAPVVQDVYPILGHDGALVAMFSVEISLIQLERHRGRHPAFRQAIDMLKSMCMRGELVSTERLSAFSEWDGVMLVDTQRRITYMSGIANNLYRRLGYMEDLRSKRLSFLNTEDDELAANVLASRMPMEVETLEGSRVWIRKVLPIWGQPQGGFPRSILSVRRTNDVRGVLIMVHDATEDRRKRQELKVKTTMIQEVHHRVKNNLQAVAAMLRIQARRTEDPAALHAIQEAVSRILSVAVIHEFLSRDERQSINIRDVCQRIITQIRQVAVEPGSQITFALEGPNIYLPSQQATAYSLVVNELIQNALEHGFEQRQVGHVRVALSDEGDMVRLEIWDDGDRLPESFDLSNPPSLGLQIVRTLVQDDLHGELTLSNHEAGVCAMVQFPKTAAMPE